jgi:hypothetical protein
MATADRLDAKAEVVQPRRIGVVWYRTARGPQHVPEVAIEVLHVRLAVEREGVLAKAQRAEHHAVVERFRPRHVGHGDVDVVDPGDVSHGV